MKIVSVDLYAWNFDFLGDEGFVPIPFPDKLPENIEDIPMGNSYRINFGIELEPYLMVTGTVELFGKNSCNEHSEPSESIEYERFVQAYNFYKKLLTK